MRLTTSVPVQLSAWVAALFPLMLAVLFHTGLRPVPLSITTTKLPSLAFDQYAVDLRKIRPASTVEATYRFQNRGSQAAKITNVVTSCQCLSWTLQGARDNQIEAGGLGQIVIRMQTSIVAPGPHEYTITVHYNDPEPRQTELLLKLITPQTLWANPPWVSVFHPKGSAPTVQDIQISDGRGKPFDITDVSIDTDLVEAVIGDRDRLPNGTVQQSVRISIAGDLPPGRKQYFLRIKTTAPDVPELKVPVLLEGATASADSDADHEAPRKH